jgi:hypothetical protein
MTSTTTSASSVKGPFDAAPATATGVAITGDTAGIVRMLKKLDTQLEYSRRDAIGQYIRMEAERLNQLLTQSLKDLTEQLGTKIEQVQSLTAENEQLRSASAERDVTAGAPIRRHLSGSGKEVEEVKGDIYVIRKGDDQGGSKDECFHVRALSWDQVEAYRRERYPYNSKTERFAVQDIRHYVPVVSAPQSEGPSRGAPADVTATEEEEQAAAAAAADE